MAGFNGILETGQVEDLQLVEKINRSERIVSRFKSKLVKIIKDAGSKFDDHSISPKGKQILLNWDYRTTGNFFY